VKFFDSAQTLFRLGVVQQGDVHQARQQCGSSEAPGEAISNCAVVPSSAIAPLHGMAALACGAPAFDRSTSLLFAGSTESRDHRVPGENIVATHIAKRFAASTFETNIIHCRRPQVTRRFASCRRLHHLQPNRSRRVAGRVR